MQQKQGHDALFEAIFLLDLWQNIKSILQLKLDSIFTNKSLSFAWWCNHVKTCNHNAKTATVIVEFVFKCNTWVIRKRRQCFFPLSAFVPCWWWSYVFGLQVNRYNRRGIEAIPFNSLDPLSATQLICCCLSFTWNFPTGNMSSVCILQMALWVIVVITAQGGKLNEGQRRGLGPILPMIRSLSLHRVLMRRGVPVWVAGHVAVGRHVHSLGRRWHVPYGRDGWRARGQSDGARQRVTLVGITALL